MLITIDINLINFVSLRIKHIIINITSVIFNVFIPFHNLKKHISNINDTTPVVSVT